MPKTRVVQNEVTPYIEKYVSIILPMTRKKLKGWEEICRRISNKNKSNTAINAIKSKSVHALGGSIMAAATPEKSCEDLLNRYIALALILDYIDDIQEKDHFDYNHALALNQALLYSLGGIADTPSSYPSSKSLDKTYLLRLTTEVRNNITHLPSYNQVFAHMTKSMSDFVRSQAISCCAQNEREKKYRLWKKKDSKLKHKLTWFEFGAIQASPLRSYALLKLAYERKPSTERIRNSLETYTWLGGINVLGDHMIDLEKDQEEDEVNQVSMYETPEDAEEGLRKMIENAQESLENLYDEDFHRNVLHLLINLYMRPLLKKGNWKNMASSLLNEFPLPLSSELDNSFK